MEWDQEVFKEGMSIFCIGKGCKLLSPECGEADCTICIWLHGYMPPHMLFLNVILLHVHQEVGSMFPLCECVWTCDYRRRDATWLLSYTIKGDINSLSPLLGMLILRIQTQCYEKAKQSRISSQGLTWGPGQQQPQPCDIQMGSLQRTQAPSLTPFQVSPSGAKKKCSCWALPKSQTC